MGRRTECCSCFRAVFKPSHETDTQMKPLPKPPARSGALVAASPDATDGLPYIDSADILTVLTVDPCITSNSYQHHTDKFELVNRSVLPRLVVRRGQAFRLILSLSRPYDAEKDGISFIFTVEDEEKPSYGQHTLAAVPLLRKFSKELPWNAVVESQTDSNLTVNITPPPDCVVAPWKMDIDTKLKEDGAVSYSYPTAIYILFNPWCKKDSVFMDSDEWKEETVLNDVGLIFRGSYNRIRPCVWKYAQFEKHILECSLYLVHKIGHVNGSSRADPVKTARAISAAVNSADDNGAVMGNWTEEFDGGTEPTKWVGSMEILQKYYKKKKPVKYGQCWVFSGVLTTICRAIGIPCRPVTNYCSAHDTQNSLTVDYFVGEDGEVMEELNSDTIWNFHVWNEVWMNRPDMGAIYGGWQAVDATPQFLSEDKFRVGPTSVVAVKFGEVMRPHDTAFLFAEVNADKVFWRYYGPTQPLKLLRSDEHHVGQLISTKAPGKWDREDITFAYKHSEKSKEERNTMVKALRQSENIFSRYYLNEVFNDITFDFELKDDIKIGQPFDVVLAMKNRHKSKSYSVKVVLRVDCVNYMGKVKDSVKVLKTEAEVKANSEQQIKMNVTYNEYRKRLVDQCAFNISCLASVKDTKFDYFAQDDFRVRKPDIKIKLLGEAKVGKQVTAEITMENPLPVPLKKGEFKIEGPGLEETLTVKVGYTVETGLKATAGLQFTPPKAGRQTIVAKFTSKELNDVDGFLVFMVAPEDEKTNEATT